MMIQQQIGRKLEMIETIKDNRVEPTSLARTHSESCKPVLICGYIRSPEEELAAPRAVPRILPPNSSAAPKPKP
jgi:hypothetical protein